MEPIIKPPLHQTQGKPTLNAGVPFQYSTSDINSKKHCTARTGVELFPLAKSKMDIVYGWLKPSITERISVLLWFNRCLKGNLLGPCAERVIDSRERPKANTVPVWHTYIWKTYSVYKYPTIYFQGVLYFACHSRSRNHADIDEDHNPTSQSSASKQPKASLMKGERVDVCNHVLSQYISFTYLSYFPWRNRA